VKRIGMLAFFAYLGGFARNALNPWARSAFWRRVSRKDAKSRKDAEDPVAQQGQRFLLELEPVFSIVHTKLAASSVLPLPLYRATCGYGQSGRVRITGLFGLFGSRL
jgi:hypothetical protein